MPISATAGDNIDGSGQQHRSQVARRTQADERKWDFTFVGDVWLDRGIRMNTVDMITIKCNPERKAGAGVFEDVFIGE